MNNTMITIPYADAIEYGENTSALFKVLWEQMCIRDRLWNPCRSERDGLLPVP